MSINSREELIEFVNSGGKVKYLPFWGHRKDSGLVTKSCLSQWYESKFEVGGVVYLTAEHYMMAEKARLFGDADNEKLVLESTNPGEAKKLGRSVKGFSEELWNSKRMDVVVNASYHKFKNNPELLSFLINTGERILVEASPVDRIWGIGLAVDDSNCQNPNNWKGLNLLGFALMQAREKLQGL